MITVYPGPVFVNLIQDFGIWNQPFTLTIPMAAAKARTTRKAR
jgi:hypothetical protein